MILYIIVRIKNFSLLLFVSEALLSEYLLVRIFGAKQFITEALVIIFFPT